MLRYFQVIFHKSFNLGLEIPKSSILESREGYMQYGFGVKTGNNRTVYIVRFVPFHSEF